ncbi:MAG: WbqC family protein [Anaerocolumna sp.]
MIVSIHQPDYIPYIGYFYKIYRSDVFAFYDDAQFSNDNRHHQNKIKTPQGELNIKIPLEYHFKDPINVVKTKDHLGWKEKHLKIIEMNYGKSKYFKEVFPFIQTLLLCNYESLADMNMTINRFLCYCFGFKTNFVKVSDLSLETKREEKVLNICEFFDANTYYSGIGAMNYQCEENFKKRNIELVYTDYKAIRYPQLWSGFIKDLSILDFVFNCGFDWNLVLKTLEKQGGNDA